MFKLKQNNTTVRTELVAGITTFMAMAYILMVNAGMFSTLGGDALGASYYNAVYIATAISAVFGTLLIGLLSNLPLAQASGMGLNAFFVYSVCIGMGFTYANALVMVLVDGIVFLLLTVTGLRRLIFDAIPKAVKAAIAPGIGLFIAFLGLQNSGIVVNSDSTLVDLHSFNIIFGHTTWAEIMPLLITIAALIAIGAMSKKKIKGAVFWGIIGGAVLYYALGLLTIDGFYASNVQSKLSLNIIQPFRDFFNISFGKVFTEGFNFSEYIAANGVGSFAATFIASMLAFCMVDMFDTLGTLYGACSAGNLLDKDGNVPNMNKAMFADAAATCFGAVCGTSTVTTFVESSAGIAEGGKTGPFLRFHGCNVLHRNVPCAHCRAHSELCNRRFAHLRGHSYDRRRQGNRLERCFCGSSRVHDHGDHAVHLQYLLWYCVRPYLLHLHQALHRQDQRYQPQHLDHRHTVRRNVLHCPLMTDIRIV